MALHGSNYIFVESAHADAQRLVLKLCQSADSHSAEDAEQQQQQRPQHRPRPGVLVPRWGRGARTGGRLCKNNVCKTTGEIIQASLPVCAVLT